ncbi:stress-response A/B barrel domain-containing protein UP3-like [Zingiber officinale]|uniref:stress-response A/B barrel domain-containing protein UP3-like n=1 Tax=Zingiber officinale TaxID=94328 RepID=UPI001C4AD191|nr:stress-response A/B barrel domain-containing protein UP3-like [Zingiber officinale]XP_042434916.1 stress-response A/B barrel domain-containing protein UP3-like [Zingiber officinale]XP_042434917.1 stress-response A/B barrel domain-containing protein UP3-like [Zingiber officinale]XP_042434918.1 stress-response A/B barrel domain-containing protein UP3-like [Zingiber officinale]
MACLKTFPYLHRSRSLIGFGSLFCSPRLSCSPHRRLFATPSSASSSSSLLNSAGMAAVSIVEHVVLFKVRDSTELSKIDAMMSGLQSLASLDVVTHLTAGPILRHRSEAASAAGFTHLLHCRYRSKDDLATYSGHPSHVAVVKELVLPISDDIMAVDWVVDLDGPVLPPPGSAMRLTLAKPKEGAAAELIETLGKVKVSAPAAVTQVSFGENFSPARAKGYGVGLLTFFRSLEALDAMDAGQKDLVDSVKEKVRPLLESFIVLDFVLPPPTAANL